MTGNLGTPPEEWLERQFESEYCGECGGDAPDHDAIPFLGNWFARCRHPIPDDCADPESVLIARIKRKDSGKPLVKESTS